MTEPPSPLPPPPGLVADDDVDDVTAPRRHLSSGPAQTFDSSGAWAGIGALGYGLFSLVYGCFAVAMIPATRSVLREAGSLASQADAPVPPDLQGSMAAIGLLMDRTLPWNAASAVVAALLTAGAIGAIRGSDAARKLCVSATVASAVVALAYSVWGVLVFGPALEAAMESLMKNAAQGSRPMTPMLGMGQNHASTVCMCLFQVGVAATLFWALRTIACRRWCGAPAAPRDGSPNAL